jgi:hypothetical protein
MRRRGQQPAVGELGAVAMISRGVPPTLISQPSASAPVGDLMPSTLL